MLCGGAAPVGVVGVVPVPAVRGPHLDQLVEGVETVAHDVGVEQCAVHDFLDRDPAERIQLIMAMNRLVAGHMLDMGDKVTVRTVAVLVVEQPPRGGTTADAEVQGRAGKRGHRARVDLPSAARQSGQLEFTDPPPGRSPDGVVGEIDTVAAGFEPDDATVVVVHPCGDRAAGTRAADESLMNVVLASHRRPVVDLFGSQVAARRVGAGEGMGAPVTGAGDRVDDPTGPVVAEAAIFAGGGDDFDGAAEPVVGVAPGHAGSGGDSGDPAGSIVRVMSCSTDGVGFRHHAPVPVPPVAGGATVGVDTGGRQAERAVGVPGDTTGPVGMRRQVSRAVVHPGFAETVGIETASELSGRRPFVARAPAAGIEQRDRPAEPVAMNDCDRTRRLRHSHRQPGRIDLEGGTSARRTGNGRDATTPMTAVPGASPAGIDDGGEIAVLGPFLFVHSAIGVDQARGAVPDIVFGGQLRTVGPGDLGDVTITGVAVPGDPAVRRDHRQRPPVRVVVDVSTAAGRIAVVAQPMVEVEAVPRHGPIGIGHSGETACAISESDVPEVGVENPAVAPLRHHTTGSIEPIDPLIPSGIRPGHDAPHIVVDEVRRATGSVGIHGQCPCGVSEFPDRYGNAPVVHRQPGDATTGSAHGDPIAAGMNHFHGNAGGVVVEADAVAMPIGDRGDGVVPDPRFDTARSGLRREMPDPLAPRVPDSVGGAATGQGPALPTADRFDRGVLGRMGIGEHDPALAEERDPSVLDHQSHVQRRRPRSAEPTAEPVARQVRSPQHQREHARELDIDLPQQELAGREVDQVVGHGFLIVESVVHRAGPTGMFVCATVVVSAFLRRAITVFRHRFSFPSCRRCLLRSVGSAAAIRSGPGHRGVRWPDPGRGDLGCAYIRPDRGRLSGWLELRIRRRSAFPWRR
ncbi:hypothetical protein NRB56_70750 [Nocardia sp. RB56]|uniref:Uncharacterized protein n=1 Tax=Nocardia aurantia TaxID=2585199 RepID=A0A7K0E065_9NOCA|nr:hypothetical protein [Nocardia aurantia]